MKKILVILLLCLLTMISNLTIPSRSCICYVMPTYWRLKASSLRQAGTATLILPKVPLIAIRWLRHTEWMCITS